MTRTHAVAVATGMRNAHGQGRRRARRSHHPAELLLSGDAGSRERAATQLQATAGNLAVATTLSRIRAASAGRAGLNAVSQPASTAAPAAGGYRRIRDLEPKAAGYTSIPAPGAPELNVDKPIQAENGAWQASVKPTTVMPDVPISLYPGTGVHDMEPGETGQTMHMNVTKDASNEIRRGEEEHLLDFEWARDLSYDAAASVINNASTTPATGATPEEAQAAAIKQVRDAMPKQLCWPLGTDPTKHWYAVYGALASVSAERDSSEWHTIKHGALHDPAEKKRLKIPEADELHMYVAGTTQIGQHGSEALIRGKYDALGGGGATKK